MVIPLPLILVGSIALLGVVALVIYAFLSKFGEDRFGYPFVALLGAALVVFLVVALVGYTLT